jgi:hypothetical protein
MSRHFRCSSEKYAMDETNRIARFVARIGKRDSHPYDRVRPRAKGPLLVALYRRADIAPTDQFLCPCLVLDG